MGVILVSFVSLKTPGLCCDCAWSLAVIGLFNIVGSFAMGWAVGRWRSKYILFWMYGSRALLIFFKGRTGPVSASTREMSSSGR